MHFSSTTVLALAGSTATLPGLKVRQGASCAPVHIVVAQASGEGKGEGTSKSLSTRLKSTIKGADSEAGGHHRRGGDGRLGNRQNLIPCIGRSC
jgi:hypothetical protein